MKNKTSLSLLFGAPLLFSLLLFPVSLHAQMFKDGGKADLGLALKLHLGISGKRSSYYYLSLAVGVSRKWRSGDINFSAMPGAQFVLNYYSKGLGTSMLDCYNRRGQLDFITSFYAIAGYDDRASSRLQFVRMFNQMSATTLWHDFEGAVSYGTSFIVNNHGRNQQIGHIGFNLDQAILLGYYNDGFWPFNRFAGDLFDRYWTGGGYLAIGLAAFGNQLSQNNPPLVGQFVEYAYDRFTGDVQSSYRLSKELLFEIIPQRDIEQSFYNRALSSITWRNINGSNFGIGLIGQCPKCDIQDALHRMLGYSRHASLSKCIPVVQGSFQFNGFQQLLNQGPQ